jgi:hypothetical protein
MPYPKPRTLFERVLVNGMAPSASLRGEPAAPPPRGQREPLLPRADGAHRAPQDLSRDRHRDLLTDACFRLAARPPVALVLRRPHMPGRRGHPRLLSRERDTQPSASLPSQLIEHQ